ncbi:hypothetical protein T06_16075 [Trichinella sp. T6]|nr:hypothetical protein T06_16075 [Trichinella sp. T6]
MQYDDTKTAQLYPDMQCQVHVLNLAAPFKNLKSLRIIGSCYLLHRQSKGMLKARVSLPVILI